MTTYVSAQKTKPERPHVHICRSGRRKKGDVRFWLDSNSFDEETTKEMTAKELRKLHVHLLIYWEDLWAQWTAVYGESKSSR